MHLYLQAVTMVSIHTYFINMGNRVLSWPLNCRRWWETGGGSGTNAVQMTADVSSSCTEMSPLHLSCHEETRLATDLLPPNMGLCRMGLGD